MMKEEEKSKQENKNWPSLRKEEAEMLDKKSEPDNAASSTVKESPSLKIEHSEPAGRPSFSNVTMDDTSANQMPSGSNHSEHVGRPSFSNPAMDTSSKQMPSGSNISESLSVSEELVEGTLTESDIGGSDNSTIVGESSDSSKSDSVIELLSSGSSSHLTEDAAAVFKSSPQSSNMETAEFRNDESKALYDETDKYVVAKDDAAAVLKSSPQSSNMEAAEFRDDKSKALDDETDKFVVAKDDNNAESSSESDILKNLSSVSISSLNSESDMVPSHVLQHSQAILNDSSLLNADDEELFSLYDLKIARYEEAIKEKDSLIFQLSNRLESVMNVNLATDSVNTSEVEDLREEINTLHIKIKETSGLLQKQKSKPLQYENCAIQTEFFENLLKCETGIQVETDVQSLLQNCDLDTSFLIELFSKHCTNSDTLNQVTLKLSDLLLTQFPHMQIQELISILQSNITPQDSDSSSEKTEVQQAGDMQSPEPDASAVLKKITSLNIVAKLIESLVNISSGYANETFSDFTPSKFQSYFLKRLHSCDAEDLEVSESESQVSDFNYVEVEASCDKVSTKPVSLEKLRKRDVSEDFSLVADFLQTEMDNICSVLPSFFSGPHGDGARTVGDALGAQVFDSIDEGDIVESDIQKIMLYKSKLETRLKNLKILDKELHEDKRLPLQQSIDSDMLVSSDDNLMEEPPLSCVSLLSLTETDYITTDSETNFSRKVSVDMSRSIQERDVCNRCEKHLDALKEKYDSDVQSLKETLENNYDAERKELMQSIRRLDSELEVLKTDKENLSQELNKHIKLLAENEAKVLVLTQEHEKLMCEMSNSSVEKEELRNKCKEFEERLRKSFDIIDEKAKIEFSLQNQIADLVNEHQSDIESIKADYEEKMCREKKHIDGEYRKSFDVLKELHESEIEQLRKEFSEKEENLLNEHTKILNMVEANHCDESAAYQKKIERLLEEKCELLTKTTSEYEMILKKNHRALVMLCKQHLSKINMEKQKLLNESIKSGGPDLDVSFSDAFDQLNRSLENGLVKFLNQNYFMGSDNEEFTLDETQYLPIELSMPAYEKDLPPKIDVKEFVDIKSDPGENKKESSIEPHAKSLESSLDSDDIYMIHSEINKLQEDFQKDVIFYKSVNSKLNQELQSLKNQIQELENQKENLEHQLKEKDKELISKESLLTAMDAAAVKGGVLDSQLSTSDIRSWQVHAAQTNSRLLHVLSDLVKTFLDIENDINSHLLEHGLIPSRSGTLVQHDDDTGQSIGSREDFTSFSLGECQNLELTEDGPDLTPRAWDLFATVVNYDNDLEGDVVLGASRRLRLAVDHVLSLLTRALENQQNNDLKVLLKRNEELSQELQEESQGRDAVHMHLVTAESNVRRLEGEIKRLEDMNRDLKEDYEMLKREFAIERNKTSHLEQAKDSAQDEIHTLKEQCELLASRLGDPEKTENDKMLKASLPSLHEPPELLQENSRLSSEKHNIQKNLNMERQSYLDRLHEMEIAIEELNAEKDDLMEKKCKEIRDLKAEMDGMDKQLQSNRKFIELQALEREQEREEYIKEINRMKDYVREKEKIQSNEAKLSKEIESLEQLLRARIEDHKVAMAKKDEVEKELRHSLDKIKDLRDVIEELEKTLDVKNRIENELRQKLAVACESVPSQDKSNSTSDSSEAHKNVQVNGESVEQLHSLQELVASQSQEMEKMSQSQTLLHELRGQIHFLEAKVEQRARQLESSFLSLTSSPTQSGTTSPSGSQDSESLHISCEDGWEMSPRSIHWLEIRRLEEKIGRLVHIDEELLKRNKELEQQLKKMKSSYTECQHENAALQEKLTEHLVQISALKSHMDEQKHRVTTPQKVTVYAKKLEELEEELEKQVENNKKLASNLQEASTTIKSLEEERLKKEETIALLQKCTSDLAKQDLLAKEKHELQMSIEEIKKNLDEKNRFLIVTEKENDELRSEIDLLKTENTSLKNLLGKAEKQVESEKAQVETLIEEMARLAANSNSDAMSLTESNINYSNKQSPTEAKADQIRSLENSLKQKNYENLMLKATVTKLERSLRCREQELELEQKRLEQDFNTVQDMVQQREKELSTLQEETEDQLKLEVEIESLEKELAAQKDIEIDLHHRIKELEGELNSYKKLSIERAKEAVDVDVLKETYEKNISHLKKQIKMLSECSLDENSDISSIVKKIMEAANTFQTEDESSSFQKILFTLLRNAIDSSLNRAKLIHEEEITNFNKSWEQKVKEELNSKESELKSEIEEMKKMHEVEKTKLIDEQNTFWQQQVNEIDQKLKNDVLEYQRLYNSVKNGNNEQLQKIEESCNEKMKSLQDKINSLLNEKLSLEKSLSELNSEIVNLKKGRTKELAILKKRLLSDFEKKKEEIVKSCQDRIESLEKELSSKLEKEVASENQHKDELSALHKYFEARWASEMKKVQDFQSEDLLKLKMSIEKEMSQKHLEERNEMVAKHNNELQNLVEKFELEKMEIERKKEKELKDAINVVQKKFNNNLLEIEKSLNLPNASGDHYRNNYTEEKQSLIALHQQEMASLKQELKSKYERQMQAQIATHNSEMKRMEEVYNKKIEEARDLIRARQVISRSAFSDNGSVRTATPSDITSSDEACSSCQEDMLPANKHILVNKIHQDGKRVLSLVEASSQPHPTLKDAQLWLEEREWILNRLKSVKPETANKQVNLKQIISELVDEVQKFRKNFDKALEENSELKERCIDLERELNSQYSKVCDISIQLKNQKSVNAELESLLSSKTAEINELKKNLLDITRFASLSMEKGLPSPSNGHNESYDVGVLRSAAEPRSMNRFSAFLPDTGDNSFTMHKTSEAKMSFEREVYAKSDNSPASSIRNISPPEFANGSSSEISKVKEKLSAFLEERPDMNDAKLHGLYWVYRRSQSYNKALIYQKRYLLMLLRGFQVTENMTLAWINHMNSELPSSSSTLKSKPPPPPLRGKAKFRSCVFVIVALQRLKFYIKRWRLLARIPSSHIINMEIQSVFQNYSFISPAMTPGDLSVLSPSLASISSSFVDKASISLRAENKQRNSRKIDQSQLIEYVHRLEVLQKQLGLDNLS